jgi:hypothetical protein
MTPFRLRDTLPSTIQKLTLYQNDDHGFSIINLHSHLPELLGGQFPFLKYITIQDTEFQFYFLRRDQYLILQDFYAVRGIDFRMGSEDQIHAVGSFGELWFKPFDMKRDGTTRAHAVSAISAEPQFLRDSQDLLLYSSEEEGIPKKKIRKFRYRV